MNLITIPSITLQNITQPFEIVAAISISLGIFQYYLKRQEEKVFVRINIILRKIENIINEETSFDVFYDRVKNADGIDTFTKWIITHTDPRAFAFDLLPQFLGQPRLLRAYTTVLKKSPVPLMQMSINYADSNKKFKTIEDSSLLAESSGHHGTLLRQYDIFFGESRDSEIIEKINESIDIPEFGILTLTNINIVQEILPQFIDIKLREVFTRTLRRELTTVEDSGSLSSAKRREQLRSRIYKKLLNEIMC